MSYGVTAFSALARVHALFRVLVERAQSRLGAHPEPGFELFLASEHWAVLAPVLDLPDAAPPPPPPRPPPLTGSASAARPDDDDDDLGGTAGTPVALAPS